MPSTGSGRSQIHPSDGHRGGKVRRDSNEGYSKYRSSNEVGLLEAEAPQRSRLQRCERMAVCGRPAGYKWVLSDLFAQVQVLPRVRPVDAAIITTAGLYGDRGSGPDRSCALEALGHFPGFSNPVF